MFQVRGSTPGLAIRRKMIETLAYPSMFVLSSLDGGCLQHRYFNPRNPACQNCEAGEECHWLAGNSDVTVLAEKPMEQLYDALAFGIEYLDSQCSRAGHNVRRCACESCEWVRAARRLAREYLNH